MPRVPKSLSIPSAKEWGAAIGAWRMYRPGEIHDGMMGMCVVTNPHVTELAAMTDSGEITLDQVKSLPEADMIESEEHFDVIRFYLNVMRVTCHADEALPEHFVERNDQVGKSISNLIENLPRMVAHARHAAQAAPECGRSIHRERAAAYSRVLRALVAADPYHFRDPPRKKEAKWHRDACALQSVLREIGKKQGTIIGSANEGTRGVQFIDGALTLAGVSHTGLGAIAKAVAKTRG